MLKVLIDENQANNVRVREGEKSGRKWKMVSQKVWIYKPGSTFPEQFEITLPDGAAVYKAGNYALDFEQLLTRGQFDSLALDTRSGVVLHPMIDKTRLDAMAKPAAA